MMIFMFLQPTQDAIARAAALIQSGELVVFPTETVYGLGADATNEVAVAKIYAAKNRPSYNPLIVHVDSLAMFESLCVPDARADTLARTLWPGPLTMVLPARPNNNLAVNVTAGLDTVAVRMPAHPVAHELIRVSGRPIAAPSANESGSLSPTRPEHVARRLASEGICVLAGGATNIGLESTVLDLTEPVAKILRSGAIGIDELEPLIGDVVFADGTEIIRAPGQLKRHYATNTPLRLNAIDVKEGEAFLGFGNTGFIGASNVGFARDLPHTHFLNLSPEGDLHQAATNLYAMLDELDQSDAKMIAVQRIPDQGLGIAINDRLKRAAVPKEEN